MSGIEGEMLYEHILSVTGMDDYAASFRDIMGGRLRRQPGGRLPRRKPDRLGVDVGVGRPVRDGPEGRDGLVELHPSLGVLGGEIQGGGAGPATRSAGPAPES